MKQSARRMFCATLFGAAAVVSIAAAAERSASGDAPDNKAQTAQEPTSESPRFLHDDHQVTQGSMIIGGRSIAYQAEAGVMVVHLKDPLDDDPPPPRDERSGPPPPQPPEAGHVVRRLFPGRQAGPPPSHHLPLQRRPRIIDGVAAHGRVRPEARA